MVIRVNPDFRGNHTNLNLIGDSGEILEAGEEPDPHRHPGRP